MNNYISALNIKTFRGIKDLQIENIGSVNILVGGNNSGKTSVLEAIQLFCNPSEYELIRIAKQRDRYRLPSRMSLSTLDSLLFLFDVNSANNIYKIDILAEIESEIGSLTIDGEVVQEILDLGELAKNNSVARAKLRDNPASIDEEVATFIGLINHTNPNKIQETFFTPVRTHIEINEYSRFLGRSEANSLINVEMLTTIDHIMQNTFNKLIHNKEIKDIAVIMLKKFDPTIEDIRYINKENRFVPIIENNNGKYIPLSFYGDGMKKALAILNAIISANGGIVLIDEFETALHTSVMESVFRFMIEVAQEMGVQLFLTTHNIEAVDKLLLASEEHLNNIRIIRLKKTDKKIFAKVTTGDIALENRKEYDMEIRI